MPSHAQGTHAMIILCVRTHTRTQTHVQVVWRALLDYFCREKGFPDDLLSIEIDLKWVQKGTVFSVFFLRAFFSL